MLKSFLSVIVINIFTVICVSQSTRINGIIKDVTTNTSIDFANVVILNPVDSSYVNFGFSDDAGHFSIEITDTLTTFILNLSKLGYEDLRDTINYSKNNTAKLYWLKVSPILLNEIIINDKAPKAISRNDTTIIDAKQFATGDERKMEDILKKLPGIEVDDKGRIKYNNKVITKVLFEGDNLLGSDYTVGTKNISSEVVDKVEVIDNFITNPLLKGIIQSDEMVVNIRVDEKFKYDISGSVELGLGADTSQTRYLGNIYLFNLGRKTKSLLVHNTNNVRHNAGDINSYDYEQKNVEFNKYILSDFYAEQSLLQKQIGRGSQYLNDVFLNNGIKSLSRISMIHPLSEKLKINSSANVFYENDINKENENTVFFQGADTLKVLNSLYNDHKLLSQKYDAATEYIDVSNGLSINTKSIFIVSRNNYLSDINRSNLKLSQENHLANFKLFNTVDIFKKIGTSLIEFYTDIKWNSLDEEATYLNPYFEPEFDQRVLNQGINSRTKNFLTFIKLLNRKNINYDISLGYQYSLRNLNTNLENNNKEPISSTSKNSLDRMDNDFFTEIYHFNKIKNWLYTFKSTFFYSALKGVSSSPYFTKNFNFNSEFELPQWWKISFKAVYDEKLTSLDRGLINPIFTDLQTKFKGNMLINKPINKELTLSVNKKNDFKGYYLGFYTSYSASIGDFGDQFNFDPSFVFTKTLFWPAETQNFVAGSRFNLILDKIKSKFTLSTSYNVNKGNNAVNEVERLYTLRGINIHFEYFLTLTKFNIKMLYSNRNSEYSINSSNAVIKNMTEKLEIKPVFNFGKKINLVSIFTFNKFINELNTNIFITSELAIDYKIKYKSLSNINLKVINPFNTKKYNLNYVNDYSLQNISLLGASRFIYATCTFDL